MAKKPTIDVSRYSMPAILPGFLVEVMCPRRCEFSIGYCGGRQDVPPHDGSRRLRLNPLEPVWSGLWPYNGQLLRYSKGGWGKVSRQSTNWRSFRKQGRVSRYRSERITLSETRESLCRKCS